MCDQNSIVDLCSVGQQQQEQRAKACVVRIASVRCKTDFVEVVDEVVRAPA